LIEKKEINLPYQPGIPVGSTRPSQTYTQIADNFTELNDQYGANGDHVAFNAASDTGKHKRITYVQQSSDASAPSTQASSYTKSTTTTLNSGALVQPEIYIRQPIDGPVYQLTKGNPNQNAGEGVCYGGLQIRCGLGNIPAGSPGTLAVAYTERFSTATIAVVVSSLNANVVAQTDNASYSATGFTAKANSGGGISFSYIAIGY
jgi:hypothetical protein